MARKQTKPRQSKPAFCFVVEGHTEKNYITRVGRIFKKKVHFYPRKPSGGCAKSVLIQAEKVLDKGYELVKQDIDFTGYVIWYDADTDDKKNNALKRKILSLAAKKGKECVILCSEPCIENWLMCHNKKKGAAHNSCAFFIKEMKILIPGYEKANAKVLDKFVTEESIGRAKINYDLPEGFEVVERFFTTK